MLSSGIQDHLYSGIRDIVWDSGHGKRTTLFSGIQTTYEYTLGSGTSFGIWDMGFGPRYSLGSRPLILWDPGHRLGYGTWETDPAILWDPDHAILWDPDHLSSGKVLFGNWGIIAECMIKCNTKICLHVMEDVPFNNQVISILYLPIWPMGAKSFVPPWRNFAIPQTNFMRFL